MTSITISTKDFSDPNFNAKTWINSALRPPTFHGEHASIDDEEGDGDAAKNTTILVTKLQMASESASREFDQLSTSVLKSMPRVLYDLKVIADDAKAAHEGVEAVKRNLGLIEGDNQAALEKLRKPHIAKTRMEECRMILLEKSDHLNKLREEQERKQKEQEEARVQAKLLAQEQEKEELEIMEPVVREEERVIDETLEYGHVQLPPLRQVEPKQRTLENTIVEDSYLTPQVSNVFKRIGVPLDKFWQ